MTLRRGAVLLTKDEDFVELRERSAEACIVVWLRVGNATNAVLKRWLSRRWSLIEAAIERGDGVIEVR